MIAFHHGSSLPVALFEVLSPHTRGYDQGDKFADYRSIETLSDYVLVDPDARVVEHRTRIKDDQWLSTFLRAGELTLRSLEVTLATAVFWTDLDRVEASARK